MSSEETFMDAILAAPDDDGLRLVYADWLEERGDPRGEFIRVQYALVDPKMGPAEQAKLAFREQELLALHGRAWKRELEELGASPLFRRGFVEGILIDAKAFLKHAETIFRLAPVRRVQFRATEDDIPVLVESSFLARLSALDFQGNYLGDLAARFLADCRHLTNLQDLGLAHCNLDLEGARALAASPYLGKLTRLDMSGNEIGNLGLLAVCNSERFSNLTTLEVASCRIDLIGLRYLLTSPLLPRLHTLDLGGNFVGNVALNTLAKSPRLAALRVLRFSNANIDSSGLTDLVKSRHVAALKEVNLSANHISGAGVQLLAESPHLAGLTDLYLMGNPIPEEDKPALRKRFRCTVHF